MRLRQKVVFAIAATLLLLFVLGASPRGQEFLRGKAPSSETHWQTDDRYIGAGLAPFVYCLVPGVVLFLYGLGDVVVRRVLRHRSNASATQGSRLDGFDESH
jgi:hypothetical protein